MNRTQLIDSIDAEFGLLDPSEFSHRIDPGSPDVDLQKVSALHRDGRLLALDVEGKSFYPGFQFDSQGRLLPVVADLVALAAETRRDESDVVFWLCRETTYLPLGLRPVDLLASDPMKVLSCAQSSWGVQW